MRCVRFATGVCSLDSIQGGYTCTQGGAESSRESGRPNVAISCGGRFQRFCRATAPRLRAHAVASFPLAPQFVCRRHEFYAHAAKAPAVLRRSQVRRRKPGDPKPNRGAESADGVRVAEVAIH